MRRMRRRTSETHSVCFAHEHNQYGEKNEKTREGEEEKTRQDKRKETQTEEDS
jgi:hypothetical protein